MNCKPNQRAIVTRTCGVKQAEMCLGMVFTVRSVDYVDSKFGPVWRVDPDNVWPAASGARLAGRPIKLGEDATLTPLPDDPSPAEHDTREIEHA